MPFGESGRGLGWLAPRLCKAGLTRGAKRAYFLVPEERKSPMQDAQIDRLAPEGHAFAEHLLADPTYSGDVSRDTLRALIAYAYAHGARVAAAEAAEAVKSA